MAYSYDRTACDVEAVAPPGWEKTVKKMKKHEEIDNPWALAWWMKGKGAEPSKEAVRLAVRLAMKK